MQGCLPPAFFKKDGDHPVASMRLGPLSCMITLCAAADPERCAVHSALGRIGSMSAAPRAGWWPFLGWYDGRDE